MLNAEPCGTYYEHAKILQEDAILEPAVKICRDQCEYINARSSRLLHVPDPKFWLDLLKERDEAVRTFQFIAGSMPASHHWKSSSTLRTKSISWIVIEAISLLDSERRIVGQEGEGEISTYRSAV
jgi:hypothetical protein